MTIEEQKTYLSERLVLENLCNSEQNRIDVENFEQATSGDKIAKYLREDAWRDDREYNTKVYLVKDKITGEVVFYFAINCGILYNEIEDVKLSDDEKKAFDRYVKAIEMKKRKGLTSNQQERADNEYINAMNKLYEVVKNPDRVSFLYSRAEDKAMKKEEERELFSDTEETEHTKNVQETFPAIDIKFLCRNKKYTPKIHLDFRLGVYVFWEMIVPQLLIISEMVGCKYIYLFAADNSERETELVKEPIMYTQDYDPYEDDEIVDKEKGKILSLVNYYQKELKFEFVAKYKILKPHFERTCFTLVQEVDSLQNNRDAVWLTHISEDNFIV